MGISFVHEHLSLFAPPLDMPLRVQSPAGLFGMKRPSSDVTYTYSHTGLDLASQENEAVFASRTGFVVLIDGAANNLRMFVRHRDQGPPFFATYYLHVKNPLFVVGDQVDEGERIASIGLSDHLHFEIRKIMETTLPNDWHVSRTEPLDPLPFLYRWDKIYYERVLNNVPSTQDSDRLDEVGVLRKGGLWMYQVKQGDTWYLIPISWADEGDKKLVDLLQIAYFGRKKVRIASRESAFFDGRRIITGARVV